MDLALTSRFDFVLPKVRLTSALLLHEMAVHGYSRPALTAEGKLDCAPK
jgi:hypothetical protein